MKLLPLKYNMQYISKTVGKKKQKAKGIIFLSWNRSHDLPYPLVTKTLLSVKAIWSHFKCYKLSFTFNSPFAGKKPHKQVHSVFPIGLCSLYILLSFFLLNKIKSICEIIHWRCKKTDLVFSPFFRPILWTFNNKRQMFQETVFASFLGVLLKF